jgi:hypothetical protein
MIINDTANKRTVDTETGDYMEARLTDREEHIYSFHIKDKNSKHIASFSVQMNIHEIADKSYVVDYKIQRSWIPSGIPEAPKYTLVDNIYVEKLSDFLMVYKTGLGDREDFNYVINVFDERTI